MNEITKQFLEVFTPAGLATRDYSVVEVATMSRYLKSRQDITVSVAEMDELAKDPNSWFYDSDMELYKTLDTMTPLESSVDFSKITNGYGISDYVGAHERYLPYIPYLQYAKINGCDIHMSVYDAYSLYDMDKRNPVLRDKIKGFNALRYNYDDPQEMPDFKFDVPKDIKYTVFTEKKYQADVTPPFSLDPIPMICVNIPYEFYARQPLPVNIYCWDIINERHRFANMTEEEFQDILTKVATNGITHPMFMRMNGEVLSSNDDMTNIMFFIAKILRIPSIPVILYLSNNDLAKNHLVSSCMRFSNAQRDIYNTARSLNKILEPEILINKPKENVIFPNHRGPGNYVIFKDTNYLCVRYLDPNKVSSQEDTMTPEEADLFAKLKKEAEDKISSDVERAMKILTMKTGTSGEESTNGAGNQNNG